MLCLVVTETDPITPSQSPSQAYPLAGRVALVTGSVRRVGRAILMKLAEEGASVVVNTRSDLAKAQELAAAIEGGHGAGRAMACLADVTDPQSVQRMVDAIVARFGRLDILVNNANARAQAEAKSFTRDDWHAVIDTTLEGSYQCAMAAAPHLSRGGAGRIVNIAGITAQIGSANHAHVVSAKAGLIGLTRALANDLGPMNITVNCVSPAIIFADDDDPNRAARLRKAFPIERVPLRRYGTVEDLADTVVSLCGPAWRFVTGQSILVNGGVHFG
jgi:3-oxoacyl-[acyl-carrier protein] reductase